MASGGGGALVRSRRRDRAGEHQRVGANPFGGSEQEGVAGWLTRVLGLLLAHTGAWFAMENRRQVLVCFWVKKQQREKEKRAGQHVETSGERWAGEERE